MHELTQDRLKKLLTYDPETGLFVWNVTHSSRAVRGDVAGTINSEGYVYISIDGKKYKANRLAFLFMNGSFPSKSSDHENLIRNDNRWVNLREATTSQNNANTGVRSHSKLGIKGVRERTPGVFSAQININSKSVFLGAFDTSDKASAAYEKAANDRHGEFARVA